MLPEEPQLPLLPESDIRNLGIQIKRMPRVFPAVNDLAMSNTRQIEAANYSRAVGVAFEQSRVNDAIRQARLRAKSRATERQLKAMNNAYRKNTRAAQRATIQHRNRYIKQIARHYLGMGPELYN